ncbi:MAG TPA: cobalamin-independent methionine synthase II family protein [Vicinamibacterales bacterium]|nr:cobalamin-independent methionine synthase II family protein [Vicinamibacterales bacterium]
MLELEAENGTTFQAPHSANSLPDSLGRLWHPMYIPTEPIGSIPRPAELVAAWADKQAGRISIERFDQITEAALRDTIRRFEDTGSPIITDGEQAKSSFATYPLDGATGLAFDGVVVPFEDGHTRQLPRLTTGPFRYATYASKYLATAKRLTTLPIKQAVISASALSLLYPGTDIPGYRRTSFLTDLVNEAVADIRQCFDQGADSVQIDFTEGRLSLKLDPSGGLLEDFVALNNRVVDHFTPQERRRIGVHTCPGGDRDSTHSADIDYAGLLPALFHLHAGRFYVQLASEKNPTRVLQIIRQHLQPHQTVYVGVTDPISPVVETAEEVRDRVLQAAKYLPVSQLGTTDDCGFAPFADDLSTSREIAFEKIRARVAGTKLAAQLVQA